MTKITKVLLINAYTNGVFPMAKTKSSNEIFWVDPEKRGIIPLKKFHLSKSLEKTIKSSPYVITFDKAFPEVIRACAMATKGRNETWINGQIVTLFETLSNHGLAHSIECWENNKLVGGLYGLALGGVFFGESMFHKSRDASKVALVYLVARLNKGGFKLLDSQFMTKHLKQFGALEITRHEYLKKLKNGLKVEADFYCLESNSSTNSILQLVTQIS